MKDRVFRVRVSADRETRPDPVCGFEVAVEVFIRVILGRIGREIEYLDLFPVAFQPSFDPFRMVHRKIVQNKEYLSGSIMDQSGHEHDEQFRFHCFLIEHKPKHTGVRNCRDHTDVHLFSRDAYYGRIPFRRKSPCCTVVARNTGFAPTIDVRLLGTRASNNGGVIRSKPLFNRVQILLIGLFHRLLRGQHPSVEKIGNRPHGHIDPILVPDELLDRFTGPESERQRKEIRGMVDDKLFDRRHLFGGKLSFLSIPATARFGQNGIHFLALIGFPECADIGLTQPGNLRYSGARHSTLAKSDYLLAQFELCFRMFFFEHLFLSYSIDAPIKN